MSFSKPVDRKLFLTWTVTSTAAWALGCSADPQGSLGGPGPGPAGGAGGGANAGAAGMAAGAGGSAAGAAGSASVAGTGGSAGSAGAGGMPVSAPDCGAQLKVLITANHDHVLAVTLADVMAGAAKVYDTQGISNHPHWLQLTAADFAKLQTGGTVRKLSCNDGHEHEFIINCVGVAMPETTSGIAGKCDADHMCAGTMASFCPELG